MSSAVQVVNEWPVELQASSGPEMRPFMRFISIFTDNEIPMFWHRFRQQKYKIVSWVNSIYLRHTPE